MATQRKWLPEPHSGPTIIHDQPAREKFRSYRCPRGREVCHNRSSAADSRRQRTGRTARCESTWLRSPSHCVTAHRSGTGPWWSGSGPLVFHQRRPSTCKRLLFRETKTAYFNTAIRVHKTIDHSTSMHFPADLNHEVVVFSPSFSFAPPLVFDVDHLSLRPTSPPVLAHSG